MALAEQPLRERKEKIKEKQGLGDTFVVQTKKKSEKQ
jgi:hypothetical protein